MSNVIVMQLFGLLKPYQEDVLYSFDDSTLDHRVLIALHMHQSVRKGINRTNDSHKVLSRMHLQPGKSIFGFSKLEVG